MLLHVLRMQYLWLTDSQTRSNSIWKAVLCKLASNRLQWTCITAQYPFWYWLNIASAGSKRARNAWEDCDDVQELKALLSKQQSQIDKLVKEKAELRKAVKAAEGQPPEQSEEDLSAQADKLLSSLSSSLLAQMVYRNKHSSSRVAGEVPNVSFHQASHADLYTRD